MDGVHFECDDLPSEFSMTLGLLDSRTATQELVVPRSIPMMLHTRRTKEMLAKCEQSDG